MSNPTNTPTLPWSPDLAPDTAPATPKPAPAAMKMDDGYRTLPDGWRLFRHRRPSGWVFCWSRVAGDGNTQQIEASAAGVAVNQRTPIPALDFWVVIAAHAVSTSLSLQLSTFHEGDLDAAHHASLRARQQIRSETETLIWQVNSAKRPFSRPTEPMPLSDEEIELDELHALCDDGDDEARAA